METETENQESGKGLFMPNVASILKQEIERLSKKQARDAVAPVRTWAAGARQGVAELKRRVARLEKQLRLLQGALTRVTPGKPEPAPAEQPSARITAKGLKSLRRRLRLSGPEFAKLLGVTPQSVYNWEGSAGALRLRQTTREAVLRAREFGVRQARQRLQEMSARRGNTRKRK